MVMEDDFTMGGGHTTQYIGHISQKSTLEIYKTLLTNIILIYMYIYNTFFK